MRLSTLLLLAITAFGLLQSSVSCTKEPEVETRIVHDTLTIIKMDTVVLTVTDTLKINQLINDTATTFILVRHGETSGSGTDPDLSAAGQVRADKLSQMLSKTPLAAVYSSNYTRTKQTAQPTAIAQGVTVQTYNPFALSAFTDLVLSSWHSKTVLVVGHSNTTPSHLNLLTDTHDWANIPDTEYDNLYVVSVLAKGRAQVTHLKY